MWPFIVGGTLIWPKGHHPTPSATCKLCLFVPCTNPKPILHIVKIASGTGWPLRSFPPEDSWIGSGTGGADGSKGRGVRSAVKMPPHPRRGDVTSLLSCLKVLFTDYTPHPAGIPTVPRCTNVVVFRLLDQLPPRMGKNAISHLPKWKH